VVILLRGERRCKNGQALTCRGKVCLFSIHTAVDTFGLHFASIKKKITSRKIFADSGINISGIW